MTSSSTEKQTSSYGHEWQEDKTLKKTRRFLRSTSILYPILLTFLVIVGTVVLVLLVTRRGACRHFHDEKLVDHSSSLNHDHTTTWVPCKKTNVSSTCACPASFIHSKINPSHCIRSETRCLHSCKHNEHCACHNLLDVQRCHKISSHWIKHEMKIESIHEVEDLDEQIHSQLSWSSHLNHHVQERIVKDKHKQRAFFSADGQTAITIDIHEDDYLINEHWTKIDTNTTEQRIVYTQLDPQTHTCRLSSVFINGSVENGPEHACPGETINPPYYFGVTCESVLVLWHGGMQLKTRRDEEWTVSRHNFEAFMPRLPVLLDPFHRYYSIYDDSMIEIKDLDGHVLGQVFTEIHHPTQFNFVDHLGTIRIANKTHAQFIRSTNENAWLEF